MTLPFIKKHRPIYEPILSILYMIIFIYVYDFGFTNDNGIHFGQIAIESLDEDRFFISYIGSMRVDDYINVALCGDLTMNML